MEASRPVPATLAPSSKLRIEQKIEKVYQKDGRPRPQQLPRVDGRAKINLHKEFISSTGIGRDWLRRQRQRYSA